LAILAAGFIGLGAMGGAMATRLLDAGVALHVLDSNPAAMSSFTQRGATASATPAEMAGQVEIIFSCLPSAAIAAKVAAGEAGAVHGSRMRVLVEMATIGKQAIEPMAAALALHGKTLVDVPISGGPRGARQGTLSAMVAGAPQAVAMAQPFLDIMAKHVFIVGETPGMAQIMKLVNNLISAANMAGAFEALVVGAKAGLDPALMVDVVNASTGRNSATVDKIPKAVLTGSFDYGARTDIFYKDVTLGLAEAEALGVPTATLSAISQLWRFAMTQGEAAEDYTSVIRHVEKWGGAEVRSRRPGDAE
jgi:3-hydroxyisobutyrate dehydrogenase-like beta-hydroxyacid dehydrogenase